MAGCVLVAIESKPVVSALLRDLEPAGFAVDVVPPGSAAGRVDRARHEVAVIRASAKAAEVVAALRLADPQLAVVVLFFDEEEAKRFPGALGADGALVGPLTALQVSSTCAMAARLTVARRGLALQARQAAPQAASGTHDLSFLKRLLFVEVKRSRRYGIPVSLALVSVDRWEELIAQLGPNARATLLGELTGVVASAVRDIDISVPFSDDRLVVLMPHTETAGGLQVARRVCARVRERSNTIPLTVSVGLASHDGHGTVSFGALVKRASEALLRAREGGGDRAVSAEPPKRRDRISIG
jgi:two-component system cell cycle response regulator